MSSITLKNLTKQFGKVTSVKSINLEIPEGKIVVFVGPSGCGKTTTLRMIAGLEKPTSGEIYFDDMLANYAHPAERNVAMVFQDFSLYPHMTAKENIALSLRIKKVDKKEIEKRVERAAKMLDIGHLLDRKPSQLSGGEKQRVACGRAIVRNPNVLLMDEPLSNLDAKLRLVMRAELKQLISEIGVTTIYVTHDQVEAMTLGDILVVMNKGEIQQVDNPLEVYNNPANVFVAGMIGTPPINLISGQISIEGKQQIFKSDEIRYPLNGWKEIEGHNGKDVILGIRPNNLRLVGNHDPEGIIKGNINVLEQHGGEAYAHISHNSRTIIVQVDPSMDIRESREVNLAIQHDKTFLFDGETEKRIGSRC